MFDLDSLNPQQREAVETLCGPVLILAGAGTGKTRVITCRVANLIRHRIAPANILAVTFTNKAAREMKERVGKLVPRKTSKDPARKDENLTICTFHSLGARILRQHIELLGYKRNFVIYDETEQLGVVKRILSRISVPKNGAKPEPKELLAMLSRYRNGSTATWIHDLEARALAEHIRKRYESALRACNAIDFDDLLLLTLRLFDEHPSVLEDCRKRFQYVMVDEYQDTNPAQFQIVYHLCRNHRNLCVVGDDDQSIYGWRGAEVANLLNLEEHFGEVKVIKLEQNYRSTNVILKAANAVICNNVRRRTKQLWSSRGEGNPITLHVFDNDADEARTIVEEIEFLRLSRRVAWDHHAILFRTNQQSRPFEMALRQAGVRYNLVGGQSYFDRREVRDFLAYLKVFSNPHDDISLLRIANVPARGLSDTTMERLLASSQERGGSVYSAMRHTDVQSALAPRTRESLRSFVVFIESTRGELTAEKDLSLQPWAERFLTATGYIDEMRRSERDPEAGENRVRNLKDLARDLDSHRELPPIERLEAFLEDVTLDSEREEEKELQKDAVTLITMHSCKGLEFRHVYVVGLEEGLLPHSRSKEEGTLDEERRLFYVAMTRAMQSLTLSYCRGRSRHGQVLPAHPSTFLKEVPAELLEDADKKARQPVSTATGRGFFAAMRESLG
jgi:superfamily I DNA/RNA helicase